MKRGFVALSTILIISAVMLAVVGTTTYLAIGEAQSTFALSQGEASLAIVEGCAEEALLRFWADGNYAGGTITQPEGTCTIIVNSPSPNYNITISVSPTDSSIADFNRKVQLQFTRGASISLTSWQEI